MATKRGKKPTKKVRNLAAKNLSAKKAKGVRGGLNFAKLGGPQHLETDWTAKVYIK